MLASSSAYTAFVTMVLFFRNIIIKELAFGAKIVPHANAALDTVLLNILFCVAQGADDPFHIMARNVMAIKRINFQCILGFVMAMPAIEYLITARCSDLAPPSIMGAPEIPRSHLHDRVIILMRSVVVQIHLGLGSALHSQMLLNYYDTQKNKTEA